MNVLTLNLANEFSDFIKNNFDRSDLLYGFTDFSLKSIGTNDLGFFSIFGASNLENELEFYFVVSEQSDLILVMLSVLPSPDISFFFSSVLKYDSELEFGLDVLHTIRIENEDELEKHDIFGCVLLEPSTLNYLDFLPKIWNKCKRVLMPVFLFEEDYLLAKKDPLKLIDKLKHSNRDLMSIIPCQIPD